MKDAQSHRRTCPSCGSNQLYTTRTGANGGYGPTLLPRLGAFTAPARFDLYLCGKCGHLAFFADGDSLARLGPMGNAKWKPVW